VNRLALSAPIVLAHGMFGFNQIGYGRLAFAEYFRGIPAALRTLGNRVLVTRVHPTAGICRRACKLAERIDAVYPGQQVHIIGHSMGGLDARALLADPAWTDRILSLTTIGTPHLGSTLADAARLRMRHVYRVLQILRLDHAGFLDVTRESACKFDRSTPAPSHVPCFSLAGNPSFEEICPPLRRFHVMMERWEGPNDGLVSMESALGFGTPLPPWPLDHLRQMNWFQPTTEALGLPNAFELYASVLENLVGLGFGAEVGAEFASIGFGSS
jgi:triacylglycerol lipase